MSDALMAKLTGGQTGGGKTGDNMSNYEVQQNNTVSDFDKELNGGRRHRKGHKGNSWLAHVKATMKLNRGKSFKQVLKMAKKSYKKSQSQSSSQSGGKLRKGGKGSKGGKGKGTRKGQYGGSGGNGAGDIIKGASPYV